MRVRTTWNREAINHRVAGMHKKADPYTMNQDHVEKQPAADEYVIGGPSDFAEDIHPSDQWMVEYDGDGKVKRNEIGQPEFRSETFNHAEKTASMDDAYLIRKANLAAVTARLMLRGRKYASKAAAEEAVENLATNLMHLADDTLIDTHMQLADQSEFPGGDFPPVDDVVADYDDQSGQADDMFQLAQESQAEQAIQSLQQGDGAGAQQAIEQMVQQAVESQQQKQASVMAAMIQKAVGDAIAKFANQQVQVQVQEQAAQQTVQEAPQQVEADDMGLLDEMLADDDGPFDDPMLTEPTDNDLDIELNQEPMDNDLDIELNQEPMDHTEVPMGPEDDILTQIFADEQMEQVQQAQQVQQAPAQQQARQARVRTASSRTVGTRPTGGVSKIGGVPSVGGGKSGVDLSSLWASAPDVTNVFG